MKSNDSILVQNAQDTQKLKDKLSFGWVVVNTQTLDSGTLYLLEKGVSTPRSTEHIDQRAAVEKDQSKSYGR